MNFITIPPVPVDLSRASPSFSRERSREGNVGLPFPATNQIRDNESSGTASSQAARNDSSRFLLLLESRRDRRGDRRDKPTKFRE